MCWGGGGGGGGRKGWGMRSWEINSLQNLTLFLGSLFFQLSWTMMMMMMIVGVKVGVNVISRSFVKTWYR